MLPLQTISDPAMAIAVLIILLILVVPAAFVWAFGRIRDVGTDADVDADDEGTDRGGAGA